jgi:hypothetical protein
MNTRRPPITRRKFIQTGSAWIAATTMAGRASSSAAPAGSPEPFDVTFYQMGEPQYRAMDTTVEDGVNINQAIRDNLKRLMQLTPETEMPGGLGTIGKARGVINVGDCIQAGNEDNLGMEATKAKQWENYVADFGLTGKEPAALLKLPVYEGFGNRDQDGFVQGIITRISQRNKQRPGVTGVSGSFVYPNVKGGGFAGVHAEGLHYAWKWGPVHFVHANMRVGDSLTRYPAVASHTFLADYLDKHVGFSGAPVIIAMHLPPTTAPEGEWPAEDRKKFYDLIGGYNVVLLLCGNTSNFKSGEWRGPDSSGSLAVPFVQSDCFNHNGPGDGFMNVIRIKSLADDPTKAQLVVARRKRNNTWGETLTAEISVSA